MTIVLFILGVIISFMVGFVIGVAAEHIDGHRPLDDD